MSIVAGSDPDAIERAAQALAAGDLVVVPTETVYGLAARADDDRAVARIFETKGRPKDHPLIVHVAGREHALPLAAAWTEGAERLAAAFWPGPVTVIVQRAHGCCGRRRRGLAHGGASLSGASGGARAAGALRRVGHHGAGCAEREPLRPRQPDHRGPRARRVRRRTAGARRRCMHARHRVGDRRRVGGRAGAAAPGRDRPRRTRARAGPAAARRRCAQRARAGHAGEPLCAAMRRCD